LGAADPIGGAPTDVMRGVATVSLGGSPLAEGFESEALLTVPERRGLVTRARVLEEIKRVKEKAAGGK